MAVVTSPTSERDEAERRFSNASAAYEAALSAGRLYSAHEIQMLKRLVDDAEAQLRQFPELRGHAAG